MKALKIVGMLILVLTIISCSTKSKKGITVVSIEEMQVLRDLDNVQLVDVRTLEEHNKGHIEHSQNIDFNSPTFDEDILQLDKEKPVVLYCKSGRRSAICAEKMVKAGFKKIYDLSGGFSEWEHVNFNIKS